MSKLWDDFNEVVDLVLLIAATVGMGGLVLDETLVRTGVLNPPEATQVPVQLNRPVDVFTLCTIVFVVVALVRQVLETTIQFFQLLNALLTEEH